VVGKALLKRLHVNKGLQDRRLWIHGEGVLFGRGRNSQDKGPEVGSCSPVGSRGVSGVRTKTLSFILSETELAPQLGSEQGRL
jgi:hypothetical protein